MFIVFVVIVDHYIISLHCRFLYSLVVVIIIVVTYNISTKVYINTFTSVKLLSIH